TWNDACGQQFLVFASHQHEVRVLLPCITTSCRVKLAFQLLNLSQPLARGVGVVLRISPLSRIFAEDEWFSFVVTSIGLWMADVRHHSICELIDLAHWLRTRAEPPLPEEHSRLICVS